jgi:hypothetical protein
MNDSDALFLMSNLSTKQTGLPWVVWFAQNGGFDHDACVWVSTGMKSVPSQMIRVSIRPDVRIATGSMSADDLELLRKWTALNLDVLIRHWDGDLSSSEDAIDAIRPITRDDTGDELNRHRLPIG